MEWGYGIELGWNGMGYYGGETGYERALDLADACMRAMLAMLCNAMRATAMTLLALGEISKRG